MHGYHSRWLARREGLMESTMHLTWGGDHQSFKQRFYAGGPGKNSGSPTSSLGLLPGMNGRMCSTARPIPCSRNSPKP